MPQDTAYSRLGTPSGDDRAVDLVSLWEYSVAFCLGHGLTETDLVWWRSLPSPADVSDSDFFADLCWVIYNAGMRETLIRSKWPALRLAFFNFVPEHVYSYRDAAIDCALAVINHRGKAAAVADGAVKILEDAPIGPKLSRMSEAEVLEYLESYPYVGRVTRYHLARNCGLDVVKPDRHLLRLAEATGYPGFNGPDALVQEISNLVGERKGMIDYILWQWLSIEGSAGEIFIRLPRILSNWRKFKRELGETTETGRYCIEGNCREGLTFALIDF